MDRLIPRLQVFEIDDQPWFPAFLRARVQTVLTGLWTAWLPPLQRTSPATQTAQILLDVFGESIREYTVVDFCSGAGGPTPAIERALNERLSEANTEGSNGGDGNLNQSSRTADGVRRRASKAGKDGEDGASVSRTVQRPASISNSSSTSTPHAVPFILTDLAPHLHSWRHLASSRPNLHFIAHPIDATSSPSPSSLLASASPPLRPSPSASSTATPLILRTFHLSFHHFPDPLATSILQNTFETANAIVIVELIERTLSSLIMEALMVVPMTVLTPFWAWKGGLKGNEVAGTLWGVDWGLLVFTYLVPIVPFVVVWDGWMSSLRARTEGEIEILVDKARRGGSGEDWRWEAGRVCHTWPLGYTSYFVGRKQG